MSSWKMIWAMDTASGYNQDDNIYFGWTGGNWSIASNNDTAAWYPNYSMSSGSWWTFTGWMRSTFWLKAGAVPDVDIGTMYLQMLRENVSAAVESGPTRRAPWSAEFNNYSPGPLFGNTTTTDNGIPQFDRITVPGYLYVISPETKPVYDDIYVAVGANSAARVEIGDDPVYADCLKLAIQIPTAWEAGEVTVDTQTGSFNPGDTAYVFVVDAGNVVSSGYEITIPTAGAASLSGPQGAGLGGAGSVTIQ